MDRWFKCSSNKHWQATKEDAEKCCNGWVETRKPILPGGTTNKVWFPKLVRVEELLKGIPDSERENTIKLMLSGDSCREQ